MPLEYVKLLSGNGDTTHQNEKHTHKVKHLLKDHMLAKCMAPELIHIYTRVAVLQVLDVSLLQHT